MTSRHAEGCLGSVLVSGEALCGGGYPSPDCRICGGFPPSFAMSEPSLFFSPPSREITEDLIDRDTARGMCGIAKRRACVMVHVLPDLYRRGQGGSQELDGFLDSRRYHYRSFFLSGLPAESKNLGNQVGLSKWCWVKRTRKDGGRVAEDRFPVTTHAQRDDGAE
jgi:hypothetical protein